VDGAPCRRLVGPSSDALPCHGGVDAAVDVLRTDTRIGRKLGAKIVAKGPPLIRRREADLAAVGVERVARVAGIRRGLPLLEDGQVVDIENVVWCTGFRTDFSWSDLHAFDGDGRPADERGLVETVPGLYFAGLIFQYSLTSDVLANGGRDAEYVAGQIATGMRLDQGARLRMKNHHVPSARIPSRGAV
jgi:putative flavoprotein involved in K+ transport